MPPRDVERQIYRASRLDEFRMYQAGELFDGSEYTPEDFIKRMTEQEESPAMQGGTAFHKVLEHSAYGELPVEVQCDGWRFVFELDKEIALPAMREVKLERAHKGTTLHGRVDGMDVRNVHDTKTTEQIDIDRYAESYQWRAYLWMSGRKSFVYDLFKVKRYPETRLMVVQDHVAVPFHAYPGMDRDVEDCLEQFAATVKALGIPEIYAKKQRDAYLNDPANLLAAG